MSALYYVSKPNERVTYLIGTANNARYAFFEMIGEFKDDDTFVLFSENDCCEDKYLTGEYIKFFEPEEYFEQIDRWYIKSDYGISMERFYLLHEGFGRKELCVSDFKEMWEY